MRPAYPYAGPVAGQQPQPRPRWSQPQQQMGQRPQGVPSYPNQMQRPSRPPMTTGGPRPQIPNMTGGPQSGQRPITGPQAAGMGQQNNRPTGGRPPQQPGSGPRPGGPSMYAQQAQQQQVAKAGVRPQAVSSLVLIENDDVSPVSTLQTRESTSGLVREYWYSIVTLSDWMVMRLDDLESCGRLLVSSG